MIYRSLKQSFFPQYQFVSSFEDQLFYDSIRGRLEFEELLQKRKKVTSRIRQYADVVDDCVQLWLALLNSPVSTFAQHHGFSSSWGIFEKSLGEDPIASYLLSAHLDLSFDHSYSKFIQWMFSMVPDQLKTVVQMKSQVNISRDVDALTTSDDREEDLRMSLTLTAFASDIEENGDFNATTVSGQSSSKSESKRKSNRDGKRLRKLSTSRTRKDTKKKRSLNVNAKRTGRKLPPEEVADDAFDFEKDIEVADMQDNVSDHRGKISDEPPVSSVERDTSGDDNDTTVSLDYQTDRSLVYESVNESIGFENSLHSQTHLNDRTQRISSTEIEHETAPTDDGNDVESVAETLLSLVSEPQTIDTSVAAFTGIYHEATDTFLTETSDSEVKEKIISRLSSPIPTAILHQVYKILFSKECPKQ